MTSRILSSTAWKMRFGRLDPGSGRRADVKLDLAAVDGREEVAADEHQHRAAEREHQDGDDRDDEAPREQRGEQPGIAVAHALEAALEPGVEAGEPASRSTVRGPWCSPLSSRPMVIGVSVRDRP